MTGKPVKPVKRNFEQESDLEKDFLNWSARSPQDLNEYITRRNIRGYDRIFAVFTNYCAAPDCRYPIPESSSFRIPFFGAVCNLCHQMYDAVHDRSYFLRLHQDWKDSQIKK